MSAFSALPGLSRKLCEQMLEVERRAGRAPADTWTLGNFLPFTFSGFACTYVSRAINALSEPQIYGGAIWQHDSERKRAILHWIALTAGEQRQGYGRDIVRTIENRAKSRGLKTLETAADDESLQFFIKLGFHTTGQQWGKYKYTMGKTL